MKQVLAKGKWPAATPIPPQCLLVSTRMFSNSIAKANGGSIPPSPVKPALKVDVAKLETKTVEEEDGLKQRPV